MKNFIIIGLAILMSGCMKLNDLAFINEPLTEYQLDNYDPTPDDSLDFILDASYDVGNIHQFTVNSGGYDIAAIYIGDINTISWDTIILYCHGQSLHMDYYWQRAKLLANCGGNERFGVLMFDYRGYGLSEGTPTEEGLYEDVRAVYGWLLEQNATPANIIAYGFSLGSAPATDLIAFGHNDTKPAKLILESPFASTDFITQESTLIDVSASYITTLKFDNAEKIKSIYEPFMWMHGEEDDYVAITNGEEIARNYPGDNPVIVRVQGANHGKDGVPQTMGFQNYLQEIENFITQ